MVRDARDRGGGLMRRCIACALWILVCLGTPAAAAAQGVVLYGASKLTNGVVEGDGLGASLLYRIDPATGVVQAVAPIRSAAGVAYRNVSGLAFQGTRLFAASNDDGSGRSILLDLDPVTGVATEIGTIGTDGMAGECRNVADLTWDESTGTLYGLGDFCDGSFANDSLLTINPTTGAGTIVGPTTADGGGNALAARPVTGVLWHAGTSALGVLNPLTGESTDPGNTDAFDCCYNGADFDPESGLLYLTLRDADGAFGTNESFLVRTDVDAALVEPEVVGTLRDGLDIPIRGFDALAFYTVDAGACFPGPLDGCKGTTREGAASLRLKPKAGNPQKNKLSFSWKKGEETLLAELGNPVGDTDYRLCVYDETSGVPAVVVDAAIPAGLSWKATKKGFQYKDKASPDVQKASLSSGDAGKAKLQVSGKGVALPTLPLSQSPTVTAQLVNDQGECWSASFTFPATKNDPKQFQDKSDPN